MTVHRWLCQLSFRQTDRQTDTQTDRQTDRHTNRGRNVTCVLDVVRIWLSLLCLCCISDVIHWLKQLSKLLVAIVWFTSRKKHSTVTDVDWSLVAACELMVLCCGLYFRFQRLMPMTHVPEIGAENQYQKTGTISWHENRAYVTYSLPQTSISLLVPVFGTDFWYVCQCHYSELVSSYLFVILNLAVTLCSLQVR